MTLNSEFRWVNASSCYVSGCIDFTSGIFAANIGHKNPLSWNAIQEAWLKYGLHSYNYPTLIRDQYEKRLCEWTGYEACALFTTGSEAVEAALRVMRHKSAIKIRAIYDAFHGKTYGPLMTLDRVATISGNKHWIIEGYRGWDAHFWSDDDIRHLKRCQDDGRLICFDEIQSGFGRTGRKFAYEHYNIRPDILVIGKGMASGFPASAVLASRNLLEPYRDEFSSTHGGGPLACGAALATIEEFERLNLVEEAKRKGEMLHGKLADFPNISSSGRGLVAAIKTVSTEVADSIVRRCRDRGLLCVHTAKPSVKIGPPLTMPDDVLMEGLEILKGVLGEIPNT